MQKAHGRGTWGISKYHGAVDLSGMFPSLIVVTILFLLPDLAGIMRNALCRMVLDSTGSPESSHVLLSAHI